MSTARSAALAGVAVAAAAVLAAAGAGGPPRARIPALGPPVVVVGAAAASPRPIVGPLAASRAFIAAYEQFVYGRLAAARLPAASPYIRRQLAAQRPQPPAAVAAAADPRLRSLTLDRQGGAAQAPARARAHAVAVVDDGPATYAIGILLERRHGSWTVTGLTEAG